MGASTREEAIEESRIKVAEHARSDHAIGKALLIETVNILDLPVKTWSDEDRDAARQAADDRAREERRAAFEKLKGEFGG